MLGMKIIEEKKEGKLRKEINIIEGEEFWIDEVEIVEVEVLKDWNKLLNID